MNINNNIKTLRKNLLEKEKYDLYKEFMKYMSRPDEDTIYTIVDKVEVNDKENMMIVLEALLDWFKSDKELYKERIIYGQIIIWEHVLNAATKMDEYYKILKDISINYYADNYVKSTNFVSTVIETYSKAHAALTNLEDTLGVDRYLDLIVGDEFDILELKMDRIKNIVEKKLDKYKEIYIKEWNTTNVYEVIRHKIIKKNTKNSICSLVKHGQERVIFFIIDGFGAAQYNWSKNVVCKNRSYTYNENIFKWLSEKKLSSEFILGSSIITDTAAGLTQIFSGKTTNETRVISSKVAQKGNSRVISTKELKEHEFNQIVDTKDYSIVYEAAMTLDESNIYYCSRYNTKEISGFSKYIFNGGNVKSIIPSERVFSVIYDEIDNKKKSLNTVYITSLDNSGHTMGAFSQFEKYEHEKINTLLKNYLIQIAKEKPEMFDNKTSIILTADHGMSESSKINIDRYVIKELLNNKGIHINLVEDNRALLVYGVIDKELELAKRIIDNYLKSIGVEATYYCKGNSIYDKMMPSISGEFDDINPDIIISLVGDGLFYSRNISSNLMHFGGHGGSSVDEVFVPLIVIELSSKLKDEIYDRFIKLS